MARLRRRGAAVATLVRLALDPALGDYHPFVAYYAAVAVVAWFGRTPPAVVTLVAGGVVAYYLFVPPRHTFAPTDPDVLLAMGLFLMVPGVIVALSHAMRRAASAEADLKERLATHEGPVHDTTDSATIRYSGKMERLK